MNIYFIVFIVIIPITIFLFTIFSDRQFKRRLVQLKNEVNKPFNNIKNSTNNNINIDKTKQIYRINDGIGFGFGKEFFTCEAKQANLSNDNLCKARNASIGIKFHKFKMNKRFNIPEIDNVVLQDYCSDKYLENNFVNILNSTWSKTGLKFYLREMVNEDELDNLSKYYNYSPHDNIIFPSCEDIVNFKENPIKFNGTIEKPPEPTPSPSQSSIIGDEETTMSSSAQLASQAQSAGQAQGGSIPSADPVDPSLSGRVFQLGASIPTFDPFDPASDAPDPSISVSASASVETFIGGPLFDTLFKAKPIPEMEPKLSPEVPTTIPENINRINDSEIKKMAALDIYILKRILGKENTLSQSDKKKIIRNIFFRMTNETQYLEDKDLHIYLVPYIADDMAFLVEGRNNRPLLVVSMYRKDCNKMEKVIENVTTQKTCGPWLETLLGNYHQLRNSENEYNEIANIDYKLNPLNPCGPREIDASPHVNAEITEMRNEEIDLMNEIKAIKNKHSHVENQKLEIDKNINKIDKLYNYDYLNDHEVKLLKNYKNKKKSVVVVVNGEKRHELYNYNKLRDDKIKELKTRNEAEIADLKAKNKKLTISINEVDNKISNLENRLKVIRDKINDKMVPKKSKVGTLEAVKTRIQTISKEISAPMYYAEKTRNVLNINLIILILFGRVNNNLSNGMKLIDINKGIPICSILTKNIIDGGMSLNKNQAVKNQLLDNRSRFTFLNLNADGSLRNVILGPNNDKNGLFKKREANKCNILGFESIKLDNTTISEPKLFCDKTEYYETGRLNALDLNAQYYFVNKLLEKFESVLNSNEIDSLNEFKKQLEYQCTGCKQKDYSNYRAEPSFIQSKNTPAFFSNEEALKNYEWLSRYIVKNRINIQNSDFIFEEAEYLYNNSDIFTDDLKNSFFPEETIVTDAIHCPILDKPNNLFNIDPTPLNDYILKKNSCNASYLNSFKDSFL